MTNLLILLFRSGPRRRSGPISSVSASAAVMHCPRLTSLCVTTRIASGPTVLTSMPRFFSRAPVRRTHRSGNAKITMLVSTDIDVDGDAFHVAKALRPAGAHSRGPRAGAGHLLQRNQSRRRQHSGLAHAAAQRFAIDARLLHHFSPSPPAWIPPARTGLSTGRTSRCRTHSSASSHPRRAPSTH